MRISPHFHLEEFTRSETAQVKHISNTPTLSQIQNLTALCKQILEPIRRHFGKPTIITSGFRCPELNMAIGGSPNSQHLEGEAADFLVRDIPVVNVFEYLSMSPLPYDQIIYEKKGKTEWIHISYKSNRQQKLIARFDPSGKPVYKEL